MTYRIMTIMQRGERVLCKGLRQETDGDRLFFARDDFTAVSG